MKFTFHSLLALAVLATGLVVACRRPEGGSTEPPPWGSVANPEGTQVAVKRATARMAPPAPVLAMLEAELVVNLAGLQEDAVGEPAYYLAYDLVARRDLWLEAQGGVIVREDRDADRTIDVDVRVGGPDLDNSHVVDGDYGPGNGLGSALPVSMSDDKLSLSQGIWLETERQYRNALTALADVESGHDLRSEQDAREHPDFSRETIAEHIEPAVKVDLDGLTEDWRKVVGDASAELAGDPLVLESRVVLMASEDNHAYVSSEGARVQTGQARVRVLFEAHAQADDGMRVHRVDGLEVHTPDQLPPKDVVLATARRLRSELLALRKAPLAEPYTGPSVLEGRAAGVFFHEIFGHRLEGHRQKDDLEGQTFTDKLGKRILPWFMDVVDDPTVTMLGELPLSGHYFVDDEGIAAQRAVLVERGKLKTFLLSRSPVLPFTKSNGHGRRERGHQVVARQGNLIVTSRRTLSRRQLRQELIAEVKRQDKPYGLWFSDVEGGFTITDRSGPQAFKVMPLLVYRVFEDGRPDQLVRGADIVGTPLAAFETILATDDQLGVFNGMCGAESGWVSVSAVSPSILLGGLEIERAAHDRGRPPLLAPPEVGS